MAGRAQSGRLRHLLRDLKRYTTTAPHVILAPLLLLPLLIGLGSSAIALFEQQQLSDIKNEVTGQLSSAASSLTNHVSYGVLPCYTLAVLVQYAPDLEANVSAAFVQAATALDRQVNARGESFSFKTVSVAPQGVISDIYPVEGNVAAIGLDLLRTSHAAADTYETITLREVTLSGPVTIVQGGVALIARYPIFVSPATETDDFSAGPHSVPSCLDNNRENFCWEPDTSTRFWGIATSLIEFSRLIEQTRLTELTGTYAWKLVRPTEEGPPEVLAESHVNRTLNGAQSILMPVGPTQEWELLMEPLHPVSVRSWSTYLYVAVTLASVILSLAVFALLVAQRQLATLLNKLLPKSIIKRLHRGETVMDRFDNVTVLFCDMRWDKCELTSGEDGGEEALAFVNDVYSIYDDLTDKHGLYKLECIGELFLLVGGCPEQEDPAKAMAKVARCAKDMLRANQGLVSPSGSKLQTRIGIHSGPAVTGVLGTKLPKFTLYGDTINVASRMQSTAQPCSIHLSYAAARLLLESSDVNSIGQRTITPVKGKGDMLTYYLDPDGPPMTQQELQTMLGDCGLAALQESARIASIASRHSEAVTEAGSAQSEKSSSTLDQHSELLRDA